MSTSATIIIYGQNKASFNNSYSLEKIELSINGYPQFVLKGISESLSEINDKINLDFSF